MKREPPASLAGETGGRKFGNQEHQLPTLKPDITQLSGHRIDDHLVVEPKWHREVQHG